MAKTRLSWNGSHSAQQQADEAFAAFKAKSRAKELAASQQKRRPRVSYHAYIKSAAWERKKRWALKQLGGKCQICETTTALHVHHLTYERLGRERLTDLQVLCAGCHSNHHEGSVTHVADPITREFRRIVG